MPTRTVHKVYVRPRGSERFYDSHIHGGSAMLQDLQTVTQHLTLNMRYEAEIRTVEEEFEMAPPPEPVPVEEDTGTEELMEIEALLEPDEVKEDDT